ncbi:MAG: pimeloyl-CoA dehydrogenase small subunit [Hydrocarboniphaga sp.]|uniref:acyl-CoA dehydrogenase family protein n=1 Tax=Hydrocarboniphaga sp. TaxID=2033016 RepID=UPI0026276795|nr:acyl-CoA dehydrogenase [Hydrocarboniphaga sp.]MDB5969968.1 pimeloyl-CoA dehydrogenase small subunit [Hydrocarboniphaga sp.]
MNLSLTEEQVLMRDTLRSFLADRYAFDTHRAILESESGWSANCWRALANELGVLGASLPETLGGSGGNAIDNLVILESMGRSLMVEPYLSTVVIGGGLLSRLGGALAEALVPKIVSGEVVIAFAWAEPQGRYELSDLRTTAVRSDGGYLLCGHKAVVVGAPWATHFVVTARTSGGERDAEGVSAFLVERDTAGTSLQSYPTVDGGRAAELRFDQVRVPAHHLLGEEGQALPMLERVMDEAIVAVCAEGLGVMRRMLDETVEYAQQRLQFGKAIASFQVLQHRMVDMHIAIEQATSLVTVATLKLDEPPRERAQAASAAKVQTGRALRLVGQSAVQIHGGMGVTEELAVGHFFKRASVIQHQFGSVDHHLRRYAERL